MKIPAVLSVKELDKRAADDCNGERGRNDWKRAPAALFFFKEDDIAEAGAG